MVDKSTDHGNNVMKAQFVFLFLSRAIYRETSTELDVKLIGQSYCKKQKQNKSTTIFQQFLCYRQQKCRQNVQNSNILTSFPWSITVSRPWKIAVDLFFTVTLTVFVVHVRTRFAENRLWERKKNELRHLHFISMVCTVTDNSSRPISGREIA